MGGYLIIAEMAFTISKGNTRVGKIIDLYLFRLCI